MLHGADPDIPLQFLGLVRGLLLVTKLPVPGKREPVRHGEIIESLFQVFGGFFCPLRLTQNQPVHCPDVVERFRLDAGADQQITVSRALFGSIRELVKIPILQ